MDGAAVVHGEWHPEWCPIHIHAHHCPGGVGDNGGDNGGDIGGGDVKVLVVVCCYCLCGASHNPQTPMVDITYITHHPPPHPSNTPPTFSSPSHTHPSPITPPQSYLDQSHRCCFYTALLQCPPWVCFCKTKCNIHMNAWNLLEKMPGTCLCCCKVC